MNATALGRRFWVFWTCALVSNIGTWAQMLVVPLDVYRLSGDVYWLGGLITFQSALALVATAIGGALTNRYRSHHILVCTLGGAGLTSCFLLYLSSASTVSTPLYVMVASCMALFAGLGGPSWQSYVVTLVPRQRRTQAVFLDSVQYQSTRLIGPAVGGAALGAFGASSVYAFDVATYIVVLIGITISSRGLADRSAASRPSASPSHVSRRGIGATLLAYRTELALLALFSGLGASMLGFFPVVAEAEHQLSPAVYGLIFSMYGLGAVAAIPLSKKITTLFRQAPARFLCFALHATSLAALGNVSYVGVLVVCIMLLGACQTVITSALIGSIHEQVEDEGRGTAAAMILSTQSIGHMVSSAGLTIAVGVNSSLTFALSAVLILAAATCITSLQGRHRASSPKAGLLDVSGKSRI